MNRYKMELDHVTVPEGAVESLMERANAPRKKTGWLRPVAAAACLALIVALPVGAVVKNFVVQQAEKNRVVVENRDHIPVEEFSEELRVKVEELKDNPDLDMRTMSFSTWTEAEVFLGVNILDNPVLDGREVKTTFNNEGELVPNDPIRVNLSIASWGLTGINMDAVYRLDKVNCFLVAFVYTEEGGGEIGFGKLSEGDLEYGALESSINASSKAYTVRFGQTSEMGIQRAQAWLSSNGATVWLDFSGRDESTLRATVQQVMDGFQ